MKTDDQPSETIADALESAKDFEWPAPEPIKHDMQTVDTLPPQLIPSPLHDWIMDISDRMQAPPDNAAATAMVMLGAAIGTGCGVKPKRLDDWLVTPNLYGGIVGRPSVVMKSPTISEVLKPLSHSQQGIFIDVAGAA